MFLKIFFVNFTLYPTFYFECHFLYIFFPFNSFLLFLFKVGPNVQELLKYLKKHSPIRYLRNKNKKISLFILLEKNILLVLIFFFLREKKKKKCFPPLFIKTYYFCSIILKMSTSVFAFLFGPINN